MTWDTVRRLAAELGQAGSLSPELLAVVERVARSLNLEAGRQRGLTDVDDWHTLTEQERGGWRRCARAAVAAMTPGTAPDVAAAAPAAAGLGFLASEWRIVDAEDRAYPVDITAPDEVADVIRIYDTEFATNAPWRVETRIVTTSAWTTVTGAAR